jgi:4-hydroxy-3-methylbut-2-enyl diphosphate reductase IspH
MRIIRAKVMGMCFGVRDALRITDSVRDPRQVTIYGELVDTICQPTKLRQRAMLELVKCVDAVVVVGGRNSNNTRRLVQLCQQNLTPARHVECAGELKTEWFDDVDTVGLTAGTSTLDGTINDVHQALVQIGLRRKEGTSHANEVDPTSHARGSAT